MNRKPTDPQKSAALPECIEEFLDYGYAISCAFNRPGTLLATGTKDGYIGIWDFETRGLAKVLCESSESESSSAVTSLSWSRNGRYLLSGQSDERNKSNNKIILWDVLSGEQVHEVELPSGATRVSLSARKPFTAVVSLQSGAPVIVELSDSPVLTALDTNINLKALIDGTGPQKQRGSSDQHAPVALLSKSGQEVYVGLHQSNRGFLLVYDVDSKQLLDVYKLPAAVTSMSLNRKGDLLVMACSDKVLRLADVQPRPQDAKPVSMEEAQLTLSTLGPSALGSLLLGEPRSLISLCPLTYHNAVDKGSWLNAVVSHDGRHVVGAHASMSTHRLNMWDRATGKLVYILEGPQGVGMKDIAWHPCRSLMVTIGTSFKVYIWAPIYNEDWSAFAPDFKELSENQDYVEAEDEFDVNKRPSPPRDDVDCEDEVEVDIFTRKPLLVFSSDEEDAGSEEPLMWLPAEVDVDAGGADAADKEATEQQSSGDASDDEGVPEVSGRAGAGADSDGAGTDQPRERKRVRFEEFDDDGFEDLLRRQEELSKQQVSKPGSKGQKRGRPPKPPTKDPDGQGLGQGLAAGARGPGGRGPQASGGSGSLLNPSADAAAYGPNSTALLGAGSSSKSLLEHQLQLQRQHIEQQQQQQDQHR